MSQINQFPPGPSYKIPGKLAREFISDPIETLSKIAQRYGDISYFRLGREHIYLINNPDLIEKILIYDHRNFKKGKRLQIAKALLGEGLVTSEGEFHNRQRRLIQPIFLLKQIRTYGDIMIDYAMRMAEGWKDGDILDINREMMELTLGIICKSVLNYDVKSEAQQVGKSLTTVRNYSKRLQNPIGQVLDKVPILPKVRGARKAMKELNTLVYELIAQRRRTEIDYNDLLTRLLRAQDTEGGGVNSRSAKTKNSTGTMSDKQVRDEVMTIFIAGHETTANALTWTFYLLSQNPDVEKRLHEELDSVLSNSTNNDNGTRIRRAVSTDDIPKLPYTERVFRESMRMYPPVWTIGRYVENDYLVGGYNIAAGSSILMSQYVMHHDPRYYEKPEIFHPDRWTEEFRTHLPRFSYFPFGGGIRGCIGESFAWMEGVLVIAAVAQRWKIRKLPSQRVKLDPAITLRPKYGMKMKLKLRK
ncbi:MAG TPA: cytochrome P450 [Nitrososphaeraceae archaeon]